MNGMFKEISNTVLEIKLSDLMLIIAAVVTTVLAIIKLCLPKQSIGRTLDEEEHRITYPQLTNWVMYAGVSTLAVLLGIIVGDLIKYIADMAKWYTR